MWGALGSRLGVFAFRREAAKPCPTCLPGSSPSPNWLSQNHSPLRPTCATIVPPEPVLPQAAEALERLALYSLQLGESSAAGQRRHEWPGGQPGPSWRKAPSYTLPRTMWCTIECTT